MKHLVDYEEYNNSYNMILNKVDILPGGSSSKESACNGGDPIWSLGQEDPLKKGMATHSSSLTR